MTREEEVLSGCVEAFGRKPSCRRAGKNASIKPKREMIHVLHILFEAVRLSEAVPATHLAPTCQTRAHQQTATLLQAVMFEMIRERRTGPNKTHFSTDHVPHLR